MTGGQTLKAYGYEGTDEIHKSQANPILVSQNQTVVRAVFLASGEPCEVAPIRDVK